MQSYFKMKKTWLYAMLSAFMLSSVSNACADYVDEHNEVYQSLDYITATGSQWIVTDIRPTCTDTVKMKFRLYSLEKTQALYCSRTKMQMNSFVGFHFYENYVRCDRNAINTSGNTALNVIDDVTLVADYSTRRFFVNSIEQDAMMSEGDYQPGSVLMLFASHTKGEELSQDIAAGDVGNRATYRLYYFELYSSGSEEPKHRLMPARRQSDSVVGLYDVVGGKFYGPANNSEAFIPSPTIRDVTAQQRYPWNGKVDISYTVAGDIAAEAKRRAGFASLKVSAIDATENVVYAATKLSGDTALTPGTHSLVWDLDAEGLSFKSSNVVFAVSSEITPATYCVVDLSAGASAASYPVSYLASPPSGGFNVDTYKTTKLVLRRIEPGSFLMCGQYNVTLTKPYYVAIFELTQKQYTLVMGTNPSAYKGDKRPVEKVSYDMVRGATIGTKWPLSSAVDSTSFMGKMRARTGLCFDLPTEAQWEYACRAGTTSVYNNGGSAESDLKKLGRYKSNVSDGKGGYSQHTAVGSYTPNALGLYDMHGNVYEWCLDWHGSLTDMANDPTGVASGTKRVTRGGCWASAASNCTSSTRGTNSPANTNDDGVRLAMTMSVDDGAICVGKGRNVKIDLAPTARTAESVEQIRYSTEWISDAISGTTVEVAVDGEMILLTEGSGCVDWIPAHNGTHTLTHKVMSGDEQIGETLTATFFVEPANPEITPTNGTTFGTSLTVTMSCPTEGATIHYTTDGTDPTAESPVYRRFRVNARTTVKAVAEKNGMLSEIVVAEYAPGRCVDPVFSLSDGAEFAHSNQAVSIRWNNDGVLRYTLDGTDPTAESPIYEGPFAISDSVELRAKVFSDEFFESSVVTASLTRVWENVATPVINAADSFTGSKTKVVISCATEGAIVCYTLDGSEPDGSSTVYAGPIYVTESCTVKVYAVNVDYLDSAVASHEIVKVWGIGDTMGKADHAFTTGTNGVPGWARVVDATAPNGEAMKSGAITHGQSSVLETTIMGPGTLTFSWRTSCEEDPGYHEWDHAELAIDGNVVLKLDGVVAWTNASVRIEGDGEHTVEWRYVKDEAESEGEDAAWVAGYGWVSDLTETQTTDVHVPYAWLLGHDPEIVDEYDAYEAGAKVTGANGHKVWESYVIGADPNDKDDSLKITAFPMKADGTPDFESITISPPQSRWNVEGAQAVFKGKSALDDAGEWQTLTDENKADMRFFKVEVVVP